jgi:hypothetical protein
MSDRAKDALRRIRAEFHREVEGLSPEDYREVLEEIAADMEAHLSAFEEGGSESHEDDDE